MVFGDQMRRVLGTDDLGAVSPEAVAKAADAGMAFHFSPRQRRSNNDPMRGEKSRS